MKRYNVLISFLLVFTSIINAQSVIPTMINYQGFLTDQNGQALNGSKQITFTLYSDSISTASIVWGEETHAAVNVENGLFNVLLGSIDTLTAADLAGERYLGIRVGVSEPEMTPRLRFASTAYSMWTEEANNAGTLDNMDSKDFVAVAGDSMNGKLVLPEMDVTGLINAKSLKTDIYRAGGMNSGTRTLSTSNVWALFFDLTKTITLSQPATVISYYNIAMAAGGAGTPHLVTRLVIDGTDVSTQISGNVTYWSNSDFWVQELAAGSHTIKVEYRTPAGGTNNPTHGGYQMRVLQVLVLGDQ